MKAWFLSFIQTPAFEDDDDRRAAQLLRLVLAVCLLCIVGYGLATWNMPVLGGALALFVTNFVTIALSATIMARLYGFGHSLSSHQNWLQSVLLGVVFVALAVPLAVSLSRIGREAVTVNEIRAVLGDQFGARSRITQLAVDFDVRPIAVRAVVIAPRAMSKKNETLQAALEKQLGHPVTLQVDQVLLAGVSNSLEAQRAQLQASSDAAAAAKAASDRVANVVALAAGVSTDAVTVDPEHKRASASAAALPGADLETYYALEQRAAASAPDWRIIVTPPLQALPIIRFANGSDVVDDQAHQAIMTSAWAAQRWNNPTLGVSGLLEAGSTPKHPVLSQRRASAIAALLQAQGVRSLPTPAAGRAFRLSLTLTPSAP